MGKERKMTKFMKIYLGVVAGLLAVLLVGLIVLWQFLSAFEITRAKYAANSVFEKYFVSGNYGGLLAETGNGDETFEDSRLITSGYNELVGEKKLEFFSVTADSDGLDKFAVTADESPIAYFKVAKSGEKASFGLEKYSLKSVELVGAKYSVKAEVPVGSSLYINNVKVGDGYISEAGIKSKSCSLMPEGVDGILYNGYKVTGLFTEPVVTAKGADGKDVTVTYNESEKKYTVSPSYEKTVPDDIKAYVLKAATAYAKRMSNDAEFSEIGQYLDSSSEIYQNVRKSAVNWVRDHSGYKISDESVSELYYYREDILSCRVKLKESLIRSGYANHVENIDLVFYMHKKQGKWLIFEIITNS